MRAARPPTHPYTIALLRSVPRLDRPRQARLDPVEGQPPDLTRLDMGCSFRPRCRFAVDARARHRSNRQDRALTSLPAFAATRSRSTPVRRSDSASRQAVLPSPDRPPDERLT
ncbi:MAG TPA: oligopeptide/dipeptide ABC transporter ATP-binding protein [Stellaceae bacterium]|nr:oligopeptide/dipeptide ABC transporter ATP-binding protein [Stellaceae bacterium]